LAGGPSRPRRQAAGCDEQGQQAAARSGAQKITPAFKSFRRTVHNKQSNNNTKSLLYEWKSRYSRIVNYQPFFALATAVFAKHGGVWHQIRSPEGRNFNR
jgi:hypothetical protein